MKFKTSSLTPFQFDVIINKSTERPFSGRYTDSDQDGSYLCRNCGNVLFQASNKFHSSCGWASFDKEIPNAIAYIPDADQIRTEITCNQCHGHLGHVFHGEKFTDLNTRHCVNSASLDFVPFDKVSETDEIILAAGCFWGVEYYLQKLDGVLLTEVGYCGGEIINPTYQQVKQQNTGHLEVVRVIWDTKKLDLTTILKTFFEIHDPEQKDGQGPDIGNQYLSAIFYYDELQKLTAQNIMQLLVDNGYLLATQLLKMQPFWIGEDYHRNYYAIKGTMPYCHGYTKRF